LKYAILILAAVLLTALAFFIFYTYQTPGHNLLLITLDTTRLDHLSVYGYPRPTTPNLEKLAGRGVAHKNLYSTSNWTLPSHASLFTGLYPNEHGALFHENGQLSLADAMGRFRQYRTDGLLPSFTTLASLLRVEGFATGGVGGGPWLHPVFGLDQGFDYYDGKSSSLNGRDARDVTDMAVRFLKETPGRFFLFLNYYDPHSPYISHLEFEHFYTRGEDRIAEMTDRYDGEIAYADKYIGRLLDFMASTGRYGRTLIIVTADHGEHFGEHGGKMGHDTSLYNELLHVPLIIKYPENYRGERFPREGWSSSSRLFHFILRALDIEGAEARGDEDRLPVSAFLEASPTWPEEWLALFRQPYKMIWREEGGPELYDLNEDPAEARNLADQRPEVVETFGALKALVRSRTRKIGGAGQGRRIDPALQQQLQALGYLEEKGHSESGTRK
jgi:hypothetical protein